MSDRPFPETYWVKPEQLLVGPYPGATVQKRAKENLANYLAAGVTYFLDLTEAAELPPYKPLLLGKARYKRCPIPDFDLPSTRTMRRILDLIDYRLLRGELVYLHCRAGLGRTGTVVGCYLVRHGLSGREALREIWRLRQETTFPRSPSPETAAQRRFVLKWATLEN